MLTKLAFTTEACTKTSIMVNMLTKLAFTTEANAKTSIIVNNGETKIKRQRLTQKLSL